MNLSKKIPDQILDLLSTKDNPVDLKEIAEYCETTEWDALIQCKRLGLLTIETLAIVLVFPPSEIQSRQMQSH